jgi:hypothetical protein
MKKLDMKVAKQYVMNTVLISIHGSGEWGEEQDGKKMMIMIEEAVKVIVVDEALMEIVEEYLHRETGAVAEDRKEEVQRAVAEEVVLQAAVLEKGDLELCLVKK